MAQCPVHDERTGSLSITWTDGSDGGKVLLYCHGCQASTAELAEAMGLSLGDLFDEPPPPRYEPPRKSRSYRQRQNGQRRGRLGKLPKPIANPPPVPVEDEAEHNWRLVTTYPYENPGGVLVEEVLREECDACEQPHKTFRQRYLVDGRRRKRKPEGFEPVLFRHPQVVAAIADGRPVWLLEGEKDVETAEALGQVATTNVQGGKAFPAELAEVFTGADVRIVLDRDDTGWARGVLLFGLLVDLAAQVRLFLPATAEVKSDFTDHVEAGYDLGQLIPVHVDEVSAHLLAAKVREKHAGVEKALAETLAQVAAAEDAKATGKAPKRAEEHRRFARRWALESEIRCEALAELMTQLQGQVAHVASEWAQEALDEAEEVQRQALTAARTAHHTLGLPVPPLLQEPAAAPVPALVPDRVQDPGPGEERPDASPAAGTAQGPGAAGAGAPGQVAKFNRGADVELRPGVSIDQPVFRIVNRQIVMVDRGRRRRNEDWDEEDDENLKLVLGLDVRIAEMEYLEDDTHDDVDRPQLMGRESTTEADRLNPTAPRVLAAVVVSFTHPDSNEQMLLRVKAEEWRDGTWLESLPGPPDYDAKPSGLALIRRAIKAVSEDIKTTERHRWTGWRRTEDGDWVFVHARGAIGPDGARPAPVLLSGPLARYDLPDPIQDPVRLREAFLQGSGAFMSKLPARVAAPLLGHTYRSAIGVNPWVLALIGSPGSYKTSVASLAMHHWGELWDRRKPASSMSGNGATLNALRIQLNRAKDALFWADDVAPTKDWGLAQKTLEEFARLVHNAEERIRAERDGQGVLDGTVPRASAMVTSEVMPRPGSGAERMLVVPFRKEDIALTNLIELDSIERRHQRAVVMASFLQWLSRDITNIRIRMQAQIGRYAEQLRESGEAVRQAESVANTWAGWLLMTEFLHDVGALSEDERATVLDRADQGLREAMVAAVDPDLPTRAGARVRELLVHALRTGVAYVDDVDTGDAPEWPLAGRLGWRRMQVGWDEAHGAKYRYEARGIRLGWVKTRARQGEGGQQLYVESTAALEQVIQVTAKQMTDAPQMDRGTAVRALHDDGILLAEARKGTTPRFTVQRSIPCEDRRTRVTALRLDELLGEDLPDEGPDGSEGPDGFGGPDGGEGGAGTSDGGDGGGDGGGCVGEVWDDLFINGEKAPALAAVGGATTSINSSTSVDVSQQSGLGSNSPTQDLTSPTEPENPVRTYTDLDGRAVTALLADQPGPCIACGVRAGMTFLGLNMHIPCFEHSTAASRSTPTYPPASASSAGRAELADRPAPAAHVEPAPPAAAAAQGNVASPSGDPVAEPGGEPKTRQESSPTAEAAPVGRAERRARAVPPAGGFTGPMVVLDQDAIWMPDGSRRERPNGLTHLGHLEQLVDELGLGTQVTKRRAWPGQIWVTAAALAGFGVDLASVDLPSDSRSRGEALRQVTKNMPFVDQAIAEGWRVGGAGDCLATWTRVWRADSDRRGIWVVLMPGLDGPEMHATERMPMLQDDPAAGTLARRLSLFASALHAPFTMSPATTGLDLMVDLRAKDRDRIFAPVDNLPWPATVSTTEGDINWSRKPRAEEAECTYLHAWDRGGSYAAGIAGLELPIGEPVHHPDGAAFDKKTPGYWRVSVPQSGDWRFPHPLNPYGNLPAQPVWLTTPTLELAHELDYPLEIHEAHLWPEHGRVFDTFYDRIRDARTQLDTDDQDAQVARNQLKAVYAFTIGMLGSETHMKNRREYAPHRRHHIIAKARSNILRRVLQIGRDFNQWPVAINKDSILYVSNEPDPIKAWPGDPKHLGRGFGQYKPEASGLLADQLQHLNGTDYRGMRDLKAGQPVDGLSE